MPIIVITHNGQMPSNGGIRKGYQVGNTLFMFGGPPEGVKLQPSPPPPSKPAVMFKNLPTCNSWGDCAICGTRDNTSVRLETADMGVRDVVPCRRCGLMMRFR